MMFTGTGSQPVETFLRAVVARGEREGGISELTPTFALPPDRKFLGVLGALSLKELGLRNFCRRGGRWRYIQVSCISN